MQSPSGKSLAGTFQKVGKTFGGFMEKPYLCPQQKPNSWNNEIRIRRL